MGFVFGFFNGLSVVPGTVTEMHGGASRSENRCEWYNGIMPWLSE